MKKILLYTVLVLIMTSLSQAPAFAAKKSSVKQPAAQVPTRTNDTEDSGEEAAGAKKAQGQTIAKNPYLGAIVIDAATGKILSEDNGDAKAPPASIIKLMNLLIVLESVKSNAIKLDDKITVTAEASKIGGSQVYLKENEVFTVDELLYALMVQSANDAAVALALHVAGTKEGFVELMNRKAQQLGMTNTTFHSVHGLPPGKDQQPDISTPRDIAKLCKELLKWDVLRYSSVKERPFRSDSDQPFIMRNHNHLIGSFEGCDGFKTGFYRAAGFSIAATAAKKHVRAIAVVFGSIDRHVRDAKAKELLAKGLAELMRTTPAPTVAPVQAPAAAFQEQAPAEEKKAEPAKTADKDVIQISMQTLKMVGIGIASLIVLIALIALLKGKKKKDLLND